MTDEPGGTTGTVDLHVPTLVWGRDEAQTGEMWNSNSIVAWVLARSGIDLDHVTPPVNGRAPGWNAGLIVAASGEPVVARYRAVGEDQGC